MNKFRQWYTTYNNEITWCLIGFLSSGGIEQLLRQNYGNAALSFGIAYLNYALNRR